MLLMGTILNSSSSARFRQHSQDGGMETAFNLLDFGVIIQVGQLAIFRCYSFSHALNYGVDIYIYQISGEP